MYEYLNSSSMLTSIQAHAYTRASTASTTTEGTIIHYNKRPGVCGEYEPAYKQVHISPYTHFLTRMLQNPPSFVRFILSGVY